MCREAPLSCVFQAFARGQAPLANAGKRYLPHRGGDRARCAWGAKFCCWCQAEAVQIARGGRCRRYLPPGGGESDFGTWPSPAVAGSSEAKCLKSQERGLSVRLNLRKVQTGEVLQRGRVRPARCMASAFLPSASRLPEWASALIWVFHFAASYSANQRGKRASSSRASASISRSIFSSRAKGAL